MELYSTNGAYADMLKIAVSNNIVENCKSILIIPEKAIDEHGYIQTVSTQENPSTKHEFHALAQMAYFQYQDDELEIEDVEDNILVESDTGETTVASGLVLYRQLDGSFRALVHKNLNRKKLLEAAYRFCTRWIRLDI